MQADAALRGLPGAGRAVRAHRVPGPPRDHGGRRPGCWPGSATRSCSTARRSTPRPAARSATPARSRPTPDGPASSTRPTPCPAWSATTSSGVDGEVERRPGGHRPVDVDRRDAIRRNHTGTHLLHWALREVLGDHVRQQGSLVAPDRLRFDFSHYEPVTADQMAEIEDLVHGEVLANPPVRALRDHQGRRRRARRDRLLRRQVRRHRAGARGRARPSSCAAAPTSGRSATSARSRSCPRARSARTSAASRPSPASTRCCACGTGEATLRPAGRGAVGAGVDEVLEGLERRLAELRAAQNEMQGPAPPAGRRPGRRAGGQPARSTASSWPGSTAWPATTTATWPSRCGPGPACGPWCSAGAADGGGVALVAAVRQDSGLDAGELIADAARLVKGGGGRGKELAVAGGKEVGGIDGALDAVRGRSLAADGRRRSRPAPRPAGAGRRSRHPPHRRGPVRLGRHPGHPLRGRRPQRRRGPRPPAPSPTLAEEAGATVVVVGLPLSLDGSVGPAARQCSRRRRIAWLRSSACRSRPSTSA